LGAKVNLQAKNWPIIGIATGLLLLLSSSNITVDSTSTIETQGAKVEATKSDQKSLSSKSKDKELTSIKTAEKEVREYFADTPILIEVARCESRFHHTDEDGSIHRGEINNKDVGVMQINEYYHLDTAKKLGFDVYSLKGNMEYARYLYDHEGLQPWVSSGKCWSKTKAMPQEFASNYKRVK
jgi:hypothetical protein